MEKVRLSAKQIEFLQRFGGEEMPESVAQILSEATFGDDYVQLNSGTLSREDYEDVRTFLERVGGKWKGSTGKKNADGSPAGKFMFKYVAPQSIVQTFVSMRFLPAKNPLDFFPTPRKVALDLLVFCGLLVEGRQGEYDITTQRKIRILEPSAGLGGVADVVREFYPDAEMVCVEMNPVSAQLLREKGYQVYEEDFLAFEQRAQFDYVLMNPPFDGTTYIKHVLHAWEMVEPRMGLVAGILPNTIQNTQKNVENFWKFVHCIGKSEPLEDGSFKDSGTNVRTIMFWIDKEMEEASKNRKEYNGYPNFGVWHLIAIIQNNEPDEWVRIKRMVRENSPKMKEEVLKIVKNIAKLYIESNGIACLSDNEIEYVAEHLIEDEQNIMEYEEEANRIGGYMEELDNADYDEPAENEENKEKLRMAKEPKFKIGDKVKWADFDDVYEVWKIYPYNQKEEIQNYQIYDHSGKIGKRDVGENFLTLVEEEPKKEAQEPTKKLVTFSKEALKFVPKAQVKIVNSNPAEFQDIIEDINTIVEKMHKSYEQDGNKNPIVHLHYFHANQDWYITEKDMDEDRQLQAYGYANLGYGGEWGYINIENLVHNPRIELDFHFEPMRFRYVMANKENKQPSFKAGDKVKYQVGDLHIEDWYGEVKSVVGLDDNGVYLYRLEAFNHEYRNKASEKHTEISEGRLTKITEETYQKHLKEWEKKHLEGQKTPQKEVWEQEPEKYYDYELWEVPLETYLKSISTKCLEGNLKVSDDDIIWLNAEKNYFEYRYKGHLIDRCYIHKKGKYYEVRNVNWGQHYATGDKFAYTEGEEKQFIENKEGGVLGIGNTKEEAIENFKKRACQSDYKEIAKLHHKNAVGEALHQGKPVADEVLNDYPELAEKYAPNKQETTEPTATREQNITFVEGEISGLKIAQKSLKKGKDAEGLAFVERELQGLQIALKSLKAQK